MRDVKARSSALLGPHIKFGIPQADIRALDRRLALDEQQRAFRGQSAPHWNRPRPPG
jgi:hypothetical protein